MSVPTPAESASAFARLHPRLQEELYRMRWTELRAIQVEAIHAILGGEGHVLISARTAGGKTEAAFLPILSSIATDHGGGVRALYVGPLKALINDQFRRLEALCERAEIPVHRWHGDVGRERKQSLVERPSGVLLITPESLESLFVNRPADLARVFHRLAFAVVDEVHAFLGTERGAHLASLLARIAARSEESVRRVGLSATLPDLDAAAEWLAPGDAAGMTRIRDDEQGAIRYALKGYLRPQSELAARREADEEGDDLPESETDRRLVDDLFRAYYGTTALVFANSRARVEQLADLARRKAERERLPNLFRVHHGSLAKAEREDTEEALRSATPTVAFCSSTLELGIDVGAVSAIGQVGPPWTVNSLLQRLGRSGRGEGQPAVLRLYVEEDEPDSRARLVDQLFPDLLQGIAMTELLLAGWLEPPDAGRLHLSTLVQQVLSVIAERGGARAERIYETLVARGAFRGMDRRTFAAVLRSLAAHDLVEQAPEGEVILGLAGEQLVRSRDFYAAFVTSEEWRVVHAGRAIGSVYAAPDLGAEGSIILAGRRWKVLEVDERRKEVVVEPSKGGRLPSFEPRGGGDIDPEVRRRMRAVLLGVDVPAYLDRQATAMLADARQVARVAGVGTRPLLEEGSETLWLTWSGSRITRTLAALARYEAGLDVTDEGIALAFAGADAAAVRAAYRAILARPPAAEDLAARFPLLTREKYDWALSAELQARIYARNSLDLPGALALARAMLGG